MSSEQLTVSGEGVVTAVPDAALQTALTVYQNARMDGLCHEGAWECAVTAVRLFDPTFTVDDEWLWQIIRQRVQSP